MGAKEEKKREYDTYTERKKSGRWKINNRNKTGERHTCCQRGGSW